MDTCSLLIGRNGNYLVSENVRPLAVSPVMGDFISQFQAMFATWRQASPGLEGSR